MHSAEIKRALPHRYPMLLVDRVLQVVPGESLVATKAVTVNEPCYAGLPASAGRAAHAYPVSLLVESWCQAAGLLAVHGKPNPDVLAGRVTLFGTISDLQLLAEVQPGDVLHHHVRAQKILSDAALLEGESLVAGAPVMRVGQVIIVLRAATELGSVNGR